MIEAGPPSPGNPGDFRPLPGGEVNSLSSEEEALRLLPEEEALRPSPRGEGGAQPAWAGRVRGWHRRRRSSYPGTQAPPAPPAGRERRNHPVLRWLGSPREPNNGSGGGMLGSPEANPTDAPNPCWERRACD